MPIQELRLIVDLKDQRKRLDKFLSEAILDRSRTRLAALITSGDVSVNGCQAKAKYRLAVGDVVEVRLPDAQATDLTPQQMELKVVMYLMQTIRVFHGVPSIFLVQMENI